MKYNNFLKTELKNILRDKLTAYMLIYPVIFALIGRYLIPYLYENYPESINGGMEVIIVIFALMSGYIYGALGGFSLLDDRDDGIFTSLKVTPISINKYIFFKFGVIYLFSIIGTMFVILFAQEGYAEFYSSISFIRALGISVIASLTAPINAFIINSLASNKVEGFAMMKGSGIILIFPIIALMFSDWKELLFIFIPGVAPAKAVMATILPMQTTYFSYDIYMLIGICVNLIWLYIFYKIFKRKNNL